MIVNPANLTGQPDALLEGEVSQVVILQAETEREHCLWSAILERTDSCGTVREFILCDSFRGHRFAQFTLPEPQFNKLREAFSKRVY